MRSLDKMNLEENMKINLCEFKQIDKYVSLSGFKQSSEWI